jgi:hypothetical protein
MKPLILLFLTIVSFAYSYSQKEEDREFNRPLRAVHAFAGTANATFGASKGNFTNTTTNWKHPFGYTITAGVGVSYMMKNSIGLEADFSYEFNSYIYKNQNVNLSLGYRAPMVDVKVKKILKPDAEDSFYIKAGVGYLFGGTGGVEETEASYSYTINFEATNSLVGMFEIGFQKRPATKNYMDIGIAYRHGFSNVISSTMLYVDQANVLNNESAAAITKGSYIGLTFKYYAVFKMWSKKHNTSRGTDSKF